MTLAALIRSHNGGRSRLRAVLVSVLCLAVVVVGIQAVPWRQSKQVADAGVALPAQPRLGPAVVSHDDDVGDPFVLPDSSGGYVLLWTTDWRSNVPMAVSTDLKHWARGPDALPVLPRWATDSKTMTWGPSAIQVGGYWVLYFSTEEAATGLECIGRARSTKASGPYVDDSAAPLVCQRSLGGDIDPSVSKDAQGHLNLVWKNDGNARHRPTKIWEQSLSGNGLALTGDAHELLGVDRSWEHGIVEGPSLLPATNGGWWLFYAAGTWQSNTYSTGVAWCSSVSGPCRKPAVGPLLSSVHGAVSPGGLETFTDHRGRLWASYSAFPSAPHSLQAAMAENRVLELAPIISH